MQDLEEEGYLVGLEKAKFVERLAHYYCEINVLHPFRVGSGLAQRIFFEQLAIHAGYQLSWQGIEKRHGIRQIRVGQWGSHRTADDI